MVGGEGLEAPRVPATIDAGGEEEQTQHPSIPAKLQSRHEQHPPPPAPCPSPAHTQTYLCQPSPKDTRLTHQLFLDRSPVWAWWWGRGMWRVWCCRLQPWGARCVPPAAPLHPALHTQPASWPPVPLLSARSSPAISLPGPAQQTPPPPRARRTGVVGLVAPHMRGGVDKPGDVVEQHQTHRAGPDQARQAAQEIEGRELGRHVRRKPALQVLQASWGRGGASAPV